MSGSDAETGVSVGTGVAVGAAVNVGIAVEAGVAVGTGVAVGGGVDVGVICPSHPAKINTSATMPTGPGVQNRAFLDLNTNTFRAIPACWVVQLLWCCGLLWRGPYGGLLRVPPTGALRIHAHDCTPKPVFFYPAPHQAKCDWANPDH